jgi:hypothetical protein
MLDNIFECNRKEAIKNGVEFDGNTLEEDHFKVIWRDLDDVKQYKTVFRIVDVIEAVNNVRHRPRSIVDKDGNYYFISNLYKIVKY